MKDILLNLANINLLNFCLENGVDCSGSYTEKDGRGFRYRLVKAETEKTLATMTFHKSSVPSFTLWV